MEIYQEKPKKPEIMLGNEAIALALLDAGANYFAAYPGTPSTEIVETAKKYGDSYSAIVHWTTNEAVAMEEAAAAAISGKYAVYASKHVGLNVAADPFMSLSYMGVRGGLVVIVADDPSMHSSQNEQDTRWYGRLAKVPILEPTDPKHAYTLARHAIKLSHDIETPVILRLTTRISHGLAPIERGPVQKLPEIPYERDTSRFVTLPANARKNKLRLLDAFAQMEKMAADTFYYKIIDNKNKLGVITSGTAAGYVEDIHALRDNFDVFIPYLTHPLPEEQLLEFIRNHETIIVVEELDDVMERDVKLLAYEHKLTAEIHGKDIIPSNYELDIARILTGMDSLFDTDTRVILQEEMELEVDPIKRLPTLCAGCPHRASFYTMTKVFRHDDPIYSNDIGCYSLGALPPFNAADSLVCMGASIAMAVGYSAVFPERTVIATIGDSTFWHTGMPGLADALWHKANMIVNILDNDITAMTGAQENPSTAGPLSIETVAKAMGAQVWVVDPLQTREYMKVMKEVKKATGVRVVISKEPCVIYENQLIKEQKLKAPPYVEVNYDLCQPCGVCYEKLNCAAISFEEGKVQIDINQCNGCSVCLQLCPRKAYTLKERE